VAEKQTQHYLRSFDVNEKLISAIDNGILILDEELKIHYFNSWLEINTRYKESELLGKSICEVFPNINEKTLKRKTRTALKMGTPSFYTASTSKYLIPIKINRLHVIDFEHMRQDVSVIPFDEERRLVALIISDQTNITNTNTLLEANILKVKELNTQLIKERATIDQKVLLIKFDTNHIITNISQAYLKLLLYKHEDLISKNFFEYQRLFITGSTKEKLLQSIQEKKVFKFEHTTFKDTGEELMLSNTLVPEYDSYANHIGFILFIEDLTASKKVIHQQEKLLSTSRSAAMGEMISMIAHQWRQPLSVINTLMATVKIKQELDILDKVTLNESFSKIEETVKYLSDTIDDFRDYFKPNKVIKDVSLTEVINKSTTFLIPEMKLLDINYTQNIGTEIKIKTYQNELIQCVINILKNSIDAFSENSIDKQTISLNVEEKNTHLTLCFSDNAGGIDSQIIKKIFEPYFSTKAKNGTGLGLYMTKTIIEEHLKGKITIKSSSDNTDVLIELPYNIENHKELS